VGNWVASNPRWNDGTPITWTWYGVEIYGGEGNDTITGGASVDFLKGEGGSDNISGGDNPASVNVPDLRGIDTVISPFNAYGDIPRGNAREVIDGGDGNNTLKGEGGDDYVYAAGVGENNVEGGWGNDLIRTGDGKDTIYGNWGNDTIFAGNGDNKVYGGDGADSITTGTGADYVEGNEGDDTISTDGGADKVYGGSGNDNISTGDGDDWINGGSGADVINAGTGIDLIDYSDSGAVVIDLMKEGPLTQSGGDAQGDQLTGIENVNGSAYGDTIRGNDLANEIWGNGGADFLYGREGDDKLHGGAGDDYISGGEGNDTLWGDDGADSLFGDGGDDTLYTEFANGMLQDRKLYTGDSVQGDTIRITGTKVGPSGPNGLYTATDMALTYANQNAALRSFGKFTRKPLGDLDIAWDTVMFDM
jgi:Ca2+-binding RTX toxin-like protein